MIDLKPHKARKEMSNVKACWWYENKRSISVFIQTEDGLGGCRINRNQLKKWLEATEPKK